MTLSGWVMLGALAIVVAGALLISRRTDGRARGLALLGLVVVAVVIGWFGWLMGTQA